VSPHRPVSYFAFAHSATCIHAQQGVLSRAAYPVAAGPRIAGAHLPSTHFRVPENHDRSVIAARRAVEHLVTPAISAASLCFCLCPMRADLHGAECAGSPFLFSRHSGTGGPDSRAAGDSSSRNVRRTAVPIRRPRDFGRSPAALGGTDSRARRHVALYRPGCTSAAAGLRAVVDRALAGARRPNSSRPYKWARRPAVLLTLQRLLRVIPQPERAARREAVAHRIHMRGGFGMRRPPPDGRTKSGAGNVGWQRTGRRRKFAE